MIPLARELLRMGAEVVMCANSQPAINDVTAPELRAVLEQVAAVCPVIKVRPRKPTALIRPGCQSAVCVRENRERRKLEKMPPPAQVSARWCGSPLRISFPLLHRVPLWEQLTCVLRVHWSCL